MNTKNVLTSWRLQLASLLVCLAVLPACEEKKDSPEPENKVEERTGLNGTDNTGTIPKNVNRNFLGTTTLPASADLTQFLPPVGDQGRFGTCVAWAVAYNCKTALEAVKFGLTRTQLGSSQYQLSPKDLFLNIEDSKKGASDCNGTDFTPALDVILQRGVATQAIAPYTGLGNCARANADAAWNADAAKHKIERYRRLDFTAAAIKTEIANKNPVILGAKLSDAFMTWNSDAVYQNHSSFDQVGIHSYHAMCIVGYDDAKGPNGAFKVVNSWAGSWGNNGFIWVDYNFMTRGGESGFAFNNNLFVASNDDQRPDPGPGPNPNPNPEPPSTGVDLVPWVFSDERDNTVGGTRRYMTYDVFNVGNQVANSSSQWKTAYIYYNAYDAEDYGLVYLIEQDPTQPVNGTTFSCSGSTCKLNVSVPGDNSIGLVLSNNDPDQYGPLWISYNMPSTLNGDYYLVMITDATSKFAEQDEDNNLFYVTDQNPVRFVNGIGGRSGADNAPRVYRNPITQQPSTALASIKNGRSAFMHTAVNKRQPNAYGPDEIVGLINHQVKTGAFEQKVQAYMNGRTHSNESGVGKRKN